MDLEYTPEEAAWQAKVLSFLDSIAKRRGPGEVEGYRRDQAKPGMLEFARAQQRKKFEAGFTGIGWPKEWHGQGGSSIQDAIYVLEEQHYHISTGFFEVGLRMCIPTICAYGTPEQCDRYAVPALRGEEIWCQLFSEPGAGSDLAALRTRAEPKDDGWLVNGQKIWTSGAQFCDFGLLLARTDPNVPKHKGLTMYFVRMDSPGMQIKPIKQMSGSSTFNEVFMNDVFIPDSQRLGAVGDGWKVGMGLLGRERFAPVSRKPDFAELLDFVKLIELENGPATDDDAVREKLADWYVRSQAVRFTRLRTMTSLSRGKIPGPEASIMKLADVSRLQEMVSWGLDLLGSGGMLNESAEPLKNLFEDAFFYGAALRVAGGTDEIQRNIIAERVLKMPVESRIDKDIPFKDVPTGAR
jgi:alkylation response protein AidB-like acyl-CoA dehydrogenase